MGFMTSCWGFSPSEHPGGRMLRPSWHVEPWEVDFDRRDRAGRGGFGEVFVGHWAGQQAAVKEALLDAFFGNPLEGLKMLKGVT